MTEGSRLINTRREVNPTLMIYWRQERSRSSDSPPGARVCRAGWSYPGGACSPRGSPSPVPTAARADRYRCPSRRHPCPRSSARAHTLPLEPTQTHTINKFHGFCSEHSQLAILALLLSLLTMKNPPDNGQVKEPFQVLDLPSDTWVPYGQEASLGSALSM